MPRKKNAVQEAAYNQTSATAAAVLLATRINPLWILGAAGALGALGLV